MHMNAESKISSLVVLGYEGQRDIHDEVVKSLSSLLNAQSKEGYWGKRDVLSKIICTCQAVQALTTAGLPSNMRSISKAIKWLRSDEIGNSEYSYWRIVPFISTRQTRSTINQELRRIEELFLEGKLKHHTKFPSKQFLWMCYLATGETDSEKLTKIEEEIVNEWSESECWDNLATSTAFALHLLIQADSKLLTDEMYKRSVKFLVTKASVDTHSHVLWDGNEIATAFTTINIESSSKLKRETDLRELSKKASNGLFGKLKKMNYQSDTFYGAEVDNEYFQSVFLRAVISHFANENYNYKLALSWRWLEQEEEKKKRWKLALITTLITTTAILLLATKTYILAVIESDSLGMVYSVVTYIIGIFVFAFDIWALWRRFFPKKG